MLATTILDILTTKQTSVRESLVVIEVSMAIKEFLLLLLSLTTPQSTFEGARSSINFVKMQPQCTLYMNHECYYAFQMQPHAVSLL